MSQEYVGIYGDGTGGVWFLIRARSRGDVELRYPMLDVFELHSAPTVSEMDLERLRVFVAPTTDPLEPVRSRSTDEQERFLEYRERVLREVRENDANSILPPDVARRLNELPRWVDIDHDDALLTYLQGLPPPDDR